MRLGEGKPEAAVCYVFFSLCSRKFKGKTFLNGGTKNLDLLI